MVSTEASPTDGPSDHPDKEAEVILTKSEYERMSRELEALQARSGAASVTSYGQLSELRVNDAQ